uniref:Pentatricopeptide repeat-containing protein n=1 Tax=Leersia perrieri TaxID=77586 RepID=A0A0D9VYP2_9ORYZ
MRPYIPKQTFAFCHSLLSSRLLPSSSPTSPSPFPVQALLTTAGLLPRHPDLTLVSLNSLLRLLSRRASSTSHPLLSLRLLVLMLSTDSPLPPPDHLSFPFALSAAVDPCPGRQIHALVVKNGLFPSDHYVTTALLQLHAAWPDDARKVFDEFPRREAIHYDLVIGTYTRAGMAAEGLGLFREMFVDGVAPNAVVLTTAIAACVQAGALECGEWHRYVERTAPEVLGDAFIGSALVSM